MNRDEILTILLNEPEADLQEVVNSDEEILDYLKAVSFTGKDEISSTHVMGIASSFGPSDCCPNNACSGQNSNCSP